VIQLLGVPPAAPQTFKPELEEGKNKGIDPVFALLLTLFLGEQPQVSLLLADGEQNGGQVKGGELAAEPLLSQHPLVLGENWDVAGHRETDRPSPMAFEEEKGEVGPQPLDPEAMVPQGGKLVGGNNLEPSLSPPEKDGIAASFAPGESLPPEQELDAAEMASKMPGSGEDKPQAGELTTAGGEGGPGKGEEVKTRVSAPEIIPPPLAARTTEAHWQPDSVPPSPPETSPLDIRGPDFMEKLVARVELARERGETQLSIQLKPEVLGKVHVEFVYREGTLSTRLVVENQEVRELLAAHLPALQETLSQQGLQLDSIAVDVFVHQQYAGDAGSRGNSWLYQQGERFYSADRSGTGDEGTGPGPVLNKEGFDYLV